MTAIVSGDSLGLGSTSFATLGRLAAQDALSSAAQGRNGEQVVVNAATGNLVLQGRDDLLVGRGLDIDSLRTYNSQGLLDDDNADNWRVGAFGQTVRLASGSAGVAGSTVVRTDRDGSASVYTWNATRNVYVGTDGAGAFDTITFDAGAAQFVWTDGDSGRIERFQASGAGRLVSASDANGNTVTLGYDAAGRPTSIVDANGDTQFYDYDGNDLSRIRTVSGGATTTTVRYGYDSAHRLVRVTVDLTPEDNAVADGKVYETTYAYDGTSRRVARIDQTDGSSLAFTYVQDGAAFKVASVTDALGAVTRFTYDRANGVTTVTDALGGQSTYRHDTQGRLTELKSGIGSANPQGLSSQRFAYDADGTADERSVVQVAYDAVGNRTQVDIRLNDLLVEHIPQYFQYDAMNRQTVVDAVDANGTIVEGQGHRLSYDEVGNRLSDTTIAPHIVRRPDGSYAVETGPTTQTYTYDAMNRLETAHTDGVLIDRRVYDAASRTLIDGPLVSLDPHYAAVHAVSLGALGTPILGHGNRYDPNGRLIEQYSFEYVVSKVDTTYQYDAVGNVKLEATWDPAVPLALRTVTLTRNTVEAAESYRQAQSITTVIGPKGVLLQQADGAETAFREWHVRDFMNRHSRIFGWDAGELRSLRSELQYWAAKAGKTWQQ
ncbi:MAG: hypothetical protein KJ832_09720 [Gammaproteobacteria bacterium]|nr:hypothetical protein [Gammaproteobacteria bacterium]